MATRYKEYQHLNLPRIGEEVLAQWNEKNAFEKSVALREGHPPFVFYEGPPSANGLPGIHHVISRTLKDLVCRYKTMQGFQVKRKGGWDTHGLPVELGVEKLLGITKEDIGKKISVEEYNATCRREVLKFKDKWDDITKKMGYWVDLNNPYVTFENNYVETLWWCLKELYKKGYLYESVSIQPYSPAAGTGLSSHELNQPGTYKDVKDTSVVAMFKAVKNKKLQIEEVDGDVFFIAWTTTPWTLPSNLGLTVGPDIEYVLVKTFNPYTHLPVNVILAKALVGKYFKAEAENADFDAYKEGDKILPWKILTSFKGKQLEGADYEQLLPSEANTIEKIQEGTTAAIPFKIILGDFVTTEDGTGIVHTAPAFGADDYKVGKKNNLGILTLVDKQGKFIDGVGEFSGRYVKNYKDEKDYVDVNVDISVKLKKENRAFKVEKFEHNYPHCWRTDKPIIYYPLDAWFIKTTAVKDRMVELNKTINWKPSVTGTGRFGNWLENMVDWNLSRSRYWGTPLPVWRTAEGDEEKCIGSIAELNSEIKKAGEVLGGETNKHYLHENLLDLHKPYVDDIILVSDSGKPMKRVADLVDVWFDSGAMPYAQWGLPDTSSNEFGPLSTANFWQYHAASKTNPISGAFPADFICEGVDQTRGWFYTLHALGALLFDSVAYKTVVSNGLVLDKNGNKMSKRLGNVVDPFDTINSFGADATRWYLITNASPWDSLKFDVEGIKEVQRKFFGTLYNTYQFFALYANVDGFAFKEADISLKDRPEIDQWILSCLNSLIKTVQLSLEDYEPTQAGRAIEEFVDTLLSNWYVRLCRRRFWKGDYAHDKICAYQTLYECLETVCKLMAPIAPFFADWLYNNLNSVGQRFDEESVHHTDFPLVNEDMIDIDLEKRMQLAQDACSLILSLRKKVNIKVRQPLQKAFIPAIDSEMAARIKMAEEIIKAETNIKEIDILGAENDFIKKKAKANFKTLGKKLGTRMKWAAGLIASFNNSEINKVQEGPYLLNPAYLSDNQEPVYITSDDLEISTDEIPGYEVANKGSLTVALDVTITDELKKEGNAREFVNKIQNIRKESNFELTDRINVTVLQNEILQSSLNQYKDYICAEILADSLAFSPVVNNGTEIEVNDAILIVNVVKQVE
ncbi:isoleucine--tRNA ligase [Ferruginibacter paludis]|uniref:isoleucine--tRNA ligase n=1 Tax=Ferruginibacter paludis TaxID=1310417 RepID=UPI0025B43D54|nr:isoleucine--tRNA ligase [Ferruginibacter paludis]MDN3658549.1 isoleucine--tRNA ligase [Ferruginibacter paludis]